MSWVRRALGCGSGAPLKTYVSLAGGLLSDGCRFTPRPEDLLIAAAAVTGGTRGGACPSRPSVIQEGT